MKTCIHCGRPKEKHAPETFICPGSGGAEGQTFATRDLPPGRMCAALLKANPARGEQV
jgi:hypothetical protein